MKLFPFGGTEEPLLHFLALDGTLELKRSILDERFSQRRVDAGNVPKIRIESAPINQRQQRYVVNLVTNKLLALLELITDEVDLLRIVNRRRFVILSVMKEGLIY